MSTVKSRAVARLGQQHVSVSSTPQKVKSLNSSTSWLVATINQRLKTFFVKSNGCIHGCIKDCLLTYLVNRNILTYFTSTFIISSSFFAILLLTLVCTYFLLVNRNIIILKNLIGILQDPTFWQKKQMTLDKIWSTQLLDMAIVACLGQQHVSVSSTPKVVKN